MSSTPTQRYEVIERLDAGGMAEVFRGRAISIEGFEKQVAIKRVLPHLAKNDKFVNMFLDEAKLSLFLDHANVVSVFDLGRAADTYFIVMEFIEGANLKKLLEWSAQHRQRMPIELAAYITAEVCKGLDYAHNKKDHSGAVLGVVHRDVSPPNVLVSRQGEVKVTDFGLAKAQSQIELTDPGVVKGKFGYLSPEAAHGEEVDLRTDVFAVGIVLWEMLAGRRLFQGKTDLETLQLVRTCDIPALHQYNPSVPAELEQIVRRALAREPKKRIQTARELGTLVSRFLVKAGLSVTSYDLAAYISRVLADEAPEPEDSGQRRVMSTVIQDEINKLIRIETKDLSQSAARLESGPLEDPRTWGDFAFDDLPPSNMRGSSYASRGMPAASSGGGTQVRTAASGVHVAVPRGGRAPTGTESAAGRVGPPPTPPPQSLAPPAARNTRPQAPAARPRNSGTQEREALEEKRAKTVFYALFGVVGIVAAYVIYLLVVAPGS